MSETDLLMDAIVTNTMLDHGASPEKLVARGGMIRRTKKQGSGNKRIPWSSSEEQYLKDHLGKVPLEEIASVLGRSENALKIRFSRKGYPSPSRLDGWLSMSRAGRLLGLDTHKAKNWFRLGILPGKIAHTKDRYVAIINMQDLKRWVTRPENWPYIKVGRMLPGHLRRLVEKAQARWGDEWLTTRQVAEMYGIPNSKTVMQDIKRGRLPAIQCRHMDGRHAGGWAYWFVRKSEALKYDHRLYTHQGAAKIWYTDRAEAFLIRLIAEHKNSGDAARLMKQDQRYLSYKMHSLRREEK